MLYILSKKIAGRYVDARPHRFQDYTLTLVTNSQSEWLALTARCHILKLETFNVQAGQTSHEAGLIWVYISVIGGCI